MKKRVLALIDFQNDFVAENGALSINNPQLIERMQNFCNNLQRGMFDEILVTQDNHFAETYDLLLESDQYGIHCQHGTSGWENAVKLKSNIPVITLYKSTTNIWNELPNYKPLQEDWKNREVYLAGVLTDVCVRQAMEGFLQRGAQVTLLEDLMQGLNHQSSDLMTEPKYGKAVVQGALRTMTSSQFFRLCLLQRKQQMKRLYNQGEVR